MSGIVSLFEPEELVGSLWHRLVQKPVSTPHFPDQTVLLADMQRRLEILHRGLGGQGGIEIKAIGEVSAGFRQTWRERLGHVDPRISMARFDGEALFLPISLDFFNSRAENENLYKWLIAFATLAQGKRVETDRQSLANDLAIIRFSMEICQQVCRLNPGLGKILATLKSNLLRDRPLRKLPAHEAAIETVVRRWLGQKNVTFDDLAGKYWSMVNDPQAGFVVPEVPHYKPMLPVVLWPQISSRKFSGPERDNDPMAENDSKSGENDGRTRKAKRNKSDQIERKDSLVIARFEAILSWAEMLNLNRAVDDDDPETAKRAAEDLEEIGLADISEKPATKLAFDLDLSPQEVDHARLADEFTYAEWDFRKGKYYQDHCNVLVNHPAIPDLESIWRPDRAARNRIKMVRRQFEALRPKAEKFYRQADGDELDMESVVRARCDFRASGQVSNRLFTTIRKTARDLAVAVLIDTSRSAQSWIGGRQVIDISKETLFALAGGLQATGDDFALYGFSSLKRTRVMVNALKPFDSVPNQQMYDHIAALRPGHYTRLGAALRHISQDLGRQGNTHKLLLVISDGKPNDIDHYEGRYGVEDTTMAVKEARRAGQAVFGITIDKKARGYFPHIFGNNAFAIAGQPEHLSRTLPMIYRHLVS